MATLEQVHLALQIIQTTSNLVRNMRDNAEGYKTEIANGTPVDKLISVFKADAVQYVRVADFVLNLSNRNPQAMIDALAAFNIDKQEAINLFNNLKQLSSSIIVTEIKSAQDLTSQANVLLGSVPTFERIF